MMQSISVKNFKPVASIKNGNIVDIGVNAPGGWSAGKELIYLFMNGMGYVNFGEMALEGFALPTVDTYFDNPAEVCLASMLNEKKIGEHTMIGPDTWGEDNFCYFETLEVKPDLSQKTDQTIIVASPLSLVSAIYNSALVVPLAVKKLVNMGVNLEQIEWAWGSSPLATLSELPDLVAMRKEAALCYGGVVSIWLRVEDKLLQDIVNKWEGLGEIRLHNLPTAKTYVGGKLDLKKLSEKIL
ncbi:MAG: methenyltetrahydromethanopterin cyclohydrolase [Zhaonellaceae bacterium]|jgi:methenyltetrahydromethanopterin cyclohydrolase|nr:hypothetical protein [Clostridia bacterium]